MKQELFREQEDDNDERRRLLLLLQHKRHKKPQWEVFVVVVGKRKKKNEFVRQSSYQSASSLVRCAQTIAQCDSSANGPADECVATKRGRVGLVEQWWRRWWWWHEYSGEYNNKQRCSSCRCHSFIVLELTNCCQ